MKLRSREELIRKGKIGGLISASRLNAAQRSARATANGNTTLQRYGIEFFKSMGRLSGQNKRKE